MMQLAPVGIVAVLVVIALALLIPLLAIAAPVIIVMVIVRAVSGSSRRNHMMDAQETRMIQEINHGLAVMERRIDNLEMIMVERKRATEPREFEASVRNGG